jgi:hypothetical protein
LVWWVAGVLLGAYIYEKTLAGCAAVPVEDVMANGSPCTLYEVNVGASIVALYVTLSAMQVFKLTRPLQVFALSVYMGFSWP